MNVLDHEKPGGVIVSLGGQTAINLAEPLAALRYDYRLRHRGNTQCRRQGML